MKNLAIKGHATRGKEVIELLEMLGGRNPHNYSAVCGSLCFYIGKENSIIYYDWVNCCEDEDLLVFTLEEFLEKFPYKIGDKVQHKDATSCGSVFEIEKIRWVNNDVEYTVKRLWYNNCHTTFTTKDLQPYKEEAMKKEISGTIVDRFICLEGYDFYDDKGNIIDTKEITMKKKQHEYPTTYTECCILLNHVSVDEVKGYKDYLIENFQILLICRDAYWKMAGDWKPDVMYGDLYCIGYDGNVITWTMQGGCRLLAFPTEEMRDAFYENFKDLIEECKELV